MFKLVLLRHGQSSWNLENRLPDGPMLICLIPVWQKLTRLVSCPRWRLCFFDVAFTSVFNNAPSALCGSPWTNWIRCGFPVINAWQLNERHYGALQGLNKAETAEKFGQEQVHNLAA